MIRCCRSVLVNFSRSATSRLHHHHHRLRQEGTKAPQHFASGCCFRSSSSNDNTDNDPDPDNGDDWILLYQRNVDRNTIPRAAFGFSVLNTAYWLWYSLDFIPAVNASPIQDLHIDPAVGLGGLGLGLLINSITVLYPLSTISKLAYSPSRQRWQLWKHDLPWILPSKTPVEHGLGQITMDKKSSDVKTIVLDKGSDLRQYQGHLGIAVQDRKIPLLLEIREPSEVARDPDFLLQALLDPQSIRKEAQILQERRKQQQKKKKQKKGKGSSRR